VSGDIFWRRQNLQNKSIGRCALLNRRLRKDDDDNDIRSFRPFL